MRLSLTRQIQELETLARKLGVQVAYEKMQTLHPRKSGLCNLRGQYRLFIDKKTSLSERVSIFAESLCLFNLQEFAITPPTRELLLRKRSELTARGRKLP